MVGVVIVAHGKLAQAFKEGTELIMGSQEYFEAVSIEAQNKVDLARERLKDAIEKVDQGEGVLILTDMFGGTPSNLSLSFLEERTVEVLTGVNLPMLIKLVNLRQESATLKLLKEKLCFYGREKIVAASDLLNQKIAQK
ncbi:PTS sugar transporter subunit IIA [bacterium]|nr:PTS sugar transporter subunit IIA [bacterium]